MPLVRYLVNNFEHPENYGNLQIALHGPCGPCCHKTPAVAVTRVSGICEDKSKFRVNLDVKQFKPEELTVKTVDNFIVVEGRHEERPDEHGFISRQFVRRYPLPEDVQCDQVQCQLSSDGVLCICVPKKVVVPVEGSERVIPINQTHVLAPRE